MTYWWKPHICAQPGCREELPRPTKQGRPPLRCERHRKRNAAMLNSAACKRYYARTNGVGV